MSSTLNPELKASVLIADDNPNTRRLLSHVMAQDGYRVFEAGNGIEALSQYETHQPDILLLDALMPLKDGFSTAAELSQIKDHAPILMITALDDEQSIEKAFQAGADDYVTKPINWTLLRKRVRRILQTRQAQRAYEAEIKERKRIEYALRENEEGFHVLFELCPDAILLLDPSSPSFPIIECNEAACRMNGYSRGELIGQSIDILHPQTFDRPLQGTAYLDMLREKGPSKIWGLHKHKNGTVFPIQSSTSLVSLNGRELIIGIDRDVTEEKRAENALEQERTLLRTLIDNLPDYVFAKDTQGRFIISNQAHDHAAGITEHGGLIGKTAADFWSPELAAQYEADDRKIIEAGEALINVERETVDENGNPRWVLTSKVPLKDRDSKITGLVGISRDITSRKQYQEQITFQASLLTEVRNAVVYTDHDRTIRYWNRWAEMLYGWKADEVLGKFAPDILAAPDAQETMAERLRSLQKDGAWEGELTARHKEGFHFPTYVNSTTVYTDDGAIKGYISVAVDITERKAIEFELNEYRQHLEHQVADRILELTAANEVLQREITERERIEAELKYRGNLEAVITWISTQFINLAPDELDKGVEFALSVIGDFSGADRSYLFLYDAGHKTISNTHEWCAGDVPSQQAMYQHIPADQMPLWMDQLKNLENVYIEHANRPSTGSLQNQAYIRARQAQSVLVVPLVYSGLLIGFLGFDSVREEKAWLPEVMGLLKIVGEIFVNALERQKTHEALYTSEEQLRRLTDNMLDIVCQTDPQGLIHYASPSCWHLLGYRPEDMLGQSIYNWVHPDDVREVHENVHTVGRVEYRYRHANGTYLWLETLSSFLFDDNFTNTGIVFASRDITERKRAEHELQELNRLKTEFLSTAAHELRTPLTSIRGFSEILITRQLDPDRQKRYGTLINEQATQLGRIIDDLLDISRLEAKRKLTLTLEPVNMPSLLDKVVPPFAETTTMHTIKVEGFENCPLVMGDAFRLAQVFKNLLSNAVKYSPEGGSIKVSGEIKDNHLEVAVQDHGIGMTPEQQTHLFESFYRADASNTSISGTGLGLTISKLIVELHGGKIWAESKHGIGTTFFFTVPLVGISVGEAA